MVSIKRSPGWFTGKHWQSSVKLLEFNAVLFFPKNRRYIGIFFQKERLKEKRLTENHNNKEK